jgi:nucleoid-associated protein YgaU
MALTPVKVLLFLIGGTAAAGATAYLAGVFDPLSAPPAQLAEPEAPKTDPKLAAVPPQDAPSQPPADAAAPPADAAAPPADGSTPPSDAAAPADAAAPPADASTPPSSEAPPAATVQAPSFDLVRVEPDGSIVIAGKAAPNAKVEVVSGSRVIGSTVAGADGDFAIVLTDPLKPGDYQLVLRSTTPDNVVATSPETAVVSIPETPDGQVLALVEKPGAPAELITVPKPEQPKTQPPAAEPPPAAADAPPAAEPPAQGGQDVAAAPAAPEETAPAPAPGEIRVTVEAVEIEGRKIFVAGIADAGRRVRAYANTILLGDAVTSPGGRFLVEAERDLPVGDYIIRVDALGADGVKVIARAAVPFQREPGENIAAVAPPATQPPAPQPAAEGDKPADVAVAPAAEPPATGKPADAAAPPASDKPADTAEAPPEPAAPPSAADQPADTAAAPAGPPAVDKPADVAIAPQEPSPPADADQAADGNAAPADASAPPAAKAPAASDVAEAPPETLAPKLQSVDGAVIIRRGDSLWRISRRVYGHGVRYSTIYLANQDQIRDPDMIWPGQVFKVPEKTKQGEAADLTGLGDQAVKIVPYTQQ